MLRAITIITIFLLSQSQSWGQEIPGYLGKRFSVTYAGVMSTALTRPTNAQTPGRVGEYGSSVSGPSHDLGNWISYGHKLQGSYVVAPKIDLTLGLNYFGSYHGRRIGIRTNSPSGLPGQGNAIEFMEMASFGRVQNIGLHLGSRFFFNYYAPLGKYIEITLGMEQVSYDDISYEIIRENDTRESHAVAGGSMLAPTFGLKLGINRVIQDQYILGFFVSSRYTHFSDGAIFQPLEGISGEDNFNVENQETSEEALARSAAGRVLVHGLFQFGFEIGFLP